MKNSRLAGCAALAHSLDPYEILSRGYTLVEFHGKVSPVEELRPGQAVTLVGQKAKAECLVQQVESREVPL